LVGQCTDSIFELDFSDLVAMLGAPEGARVACYTHHSIAMREVKPAIANMASDWLKSLKLIFPP
jgi:hypothetical protein